MFIIPLIPGFIMFGFTIPFIWNRRVIIMFVFFSYFDLSNNLSLLANSNLGHVDGGHLHPIVHPVHAIAHAVVLHVVHPHHPLCQETVIRRRQRQR